MPTVSVLCTDLTAPKMPEYLSKNIDGRFENSYSGEPTFGELLDACNDDFFEDYTLFFIYFETSSSNEFAINEITLSQDGKTVDVSYYQTNNPQFSTCDTVGKILTVPVLKSYIEGRDVFTVSNRPPEGFVAPEEPPIYAD